MSSSLRHIQSFESLIPYLEDELDWPLHGYEFDELTFEYSPNELGLKDKDAAQINRIHQLRPLKYGQPWGIFLVEFEKKKLPIVVLRRILSHLVVRKRASANRPDAAAWQVGDLLFISAFGDSNTGNGEIAFAHFHQDGTELPTLRVLGWDGGDTPLKLEHVAATLREKMRWPENPGDRDTWRTAWSGAFRHRVGHVIRTADALAEALASLARRIRQAALIMLDHESEQGALRTLHRAFQTALIRDLGVADFADTYAQTITYGLLTAAISRTDMSEGVYGTTLIAENVTDMVPITNPFLKEMLQAFLQVGGRKGGIDFDELGIQDVVELLRGEETDLPAVLRDFGNKTQGEDPVIHFYEHFLAAYDKKLKVQRGVFYTPKPVVSYIVRSVHELLQTEFGLTDGLADTTTWGEMLKKHPGLKLPPLTDEPGERRTISPDEPFVQILDPATGTATFLVEVIDVIHRTLAAKWKQQRLTDAQQRAAWNDYVPQHLLPRLHAFELMMAPYAIAHMKIGLKLAETGYRFGAEERARIYLTNALEPWVKQLPLIGFDALAHEAAAVNEIKRHKRFTVVIGNPPYAGHSSNAGEWIQNILRSNLSDGTQGYFQVDGGGLGERNPKWLNDDYVKFIRFAQFAISEAGTGVLGYITNHSYLDNPTFRGMRQSVLASFDKGFVLDLHGNIKKADTIGVDQNVFDIQQGVAIGLWRRALLQRAKSRVSRAELRGDRAAKYHHLLSHHVGTTNSIEIDPVSPFYLLVPQAAELRHEFLGGWSISEIFAVNTMGITTGRDQLCVSFTQVEGLVKVDDFTSSVAEDDLAERYGLSNKSGWNIAKARRAVRAIGVSVARCKPFGYRPMDERVLYLEPEIVGRARLEVMNHMADGNNLAICTTRQVNGEFRHVYCARGFTNDCILSNASGERAYLFPLYLAPEHRGLILERQHTPNLASAFVRFVAQRFSLPLPRPNQLPVEVTPEDIFHYAYAVFHSPGYRSRYAEFLKIDFPRLPLTGDLKLFRALARLGSELVSLHLVEFALEDETGAPGEWPRYPRLAAFSGGNRVIEKFPTANKAWQAGHVAINGSSGFTGVPEDVWNFYIGGYQVCHKWLKDRKGRTLSDDDILHYAKIVTALHETIHIMAEIDEVIEEHGGWPIQ